MQHDPISHDIINQEAFKQADVIRKRAETAADATGSARFTNDWWKTVAIECCRPVGE